jgi:hypothetical protein
MDRGATKNCRRFPGRCRYQKLLSFVFSCGQNRINSVTFPCVSFTEEGRRAIRNTIIRFALAAPMRLSSSWLGQRELEDKH